jgi:hypothetical protein
VTPNYTTIITPLRADRVDATRQYLRDHAEPLLHLTGGFLQPQLLFPFDKIENLHFCSFVIVEAEPGFEPTLIFEATFDGARDDFIRDLLRVAGRGMHEVYSNCPGYPPSGSTTPELAREYLVRHDVGAHTFFCGSPGRSVAQINEESRLRKRCAAFVSHRWPSGSVIPPRLDGLFTALQRDFLRGRPDNRWVEPPVETAWEIRSRSLVVAAAIAAVLVAACCLGAAVSIAAFGWWPLVLHEHIAEWAEGVGGYGDRVTNAIGSLLPWFVDLISPLRPAVYAVIGLAAIWLVVRIVELVLLLITDDPRDQTFVRRFPLHIAFIARCALLAFLGGFVALAFFEALASSESYALAGLGTFILVLAASLIALAIVLAVLHYWATSLKLAVELQPLSNTLETLRRLALDLVAFARVVAVAIAVLVIARHLLNGVATGIPLVGRGLVDVYLVLLTYTLGGALCGYAIGLVVMLLVRAVELSETRFDDPALLMPRAHVNAAKYAREEGGINRFQNHLTSITLVKPGFLRRWILRVTLFAIDLLARFWFNRGELGGIPTILSARWVMMDEGRRLLFLDNYGGAWDSYLNEFIDMGAVKGLNAIWSNTFVRAAGQIFTFPRTRFLFWYGAQAEQPFKAYVRQSQVETVVWYGAYPTLSVVNINDSTRLRQSLFLPLSTSEIDSILHLL